MNSIIRREFETRLKAWADAQSPKIPVAFENVPFTKPTDGSPWMECFLIPAATLAPNVDGERKREIGIFQVNVWTKTGNGMKTGEQLAQAVANLFPMVPKTGVVSIERHPFVEKSITDPSGWVVIPVTVNYRYESNI